MNQLQILKKLGAEKRLEQALELSEFVRELALDNIKKNQPARISTRQAHQKLLERLNGAYYGAE